MVAMSTCFVDTIEKETIVLLRSYLLLTRLWKSACVADIFIAHTAQDLHKCYNKTWKLLTFCFLFTLMQC